MARSGTSELGRGVTAARWYHGWNVVAVGIAIQAITIGLMTYSFTFWVAPFQSGLGASTSVIMLAASLSHVALAALSPFCGRLLDSREIRPMVLTGILIFCLGYFLIAASTAAWQVIAVYATLLPLGAALAGPLAAQVATVRWFSNKRGMALGIATLGASIGGFVFPPVVTMLVAMLGWRLSHVVLGVFIVTVVVPLIGAVIREPGTNDIEPGAATRSAQSAQRARDYPDWSIPQLLRSPIMWAIMLSFVPMLTVYLSYKFNLAPIADSSGITPRQASLVMVVHAGCAIGGKLFFGFMADTLEHRILVWTVAACLLTSLGLPQISPSYLTLILSFGMLGLAGGGFLPLMGAVSAARFGPGNIGRVIGLTGPLHVIGSFGPSLFAYLESGFGSYDPVLQIMMLLVVPAIFAAWFLGPAIPGVPSVRRESAGGVS